MLLVNDFVFRSERPCMNGGCGQVVGTMKDLHVATCNSSLCVSTVQVERTTF